MSRSGVLFLLSGAGNQPLMGGKRPVEGGEPDLCRIFSCMKERRQAKTQALRAEYDDAVRVPVRNRKGVIWQKTPSVLPDSAVMAGESAVCLLLSPRS